MFKHGFPPEWSTLKKLIWLVGSGIAGAASGIWKTVSGTLIHITDALASPVKELSVAIDSETGATGATILHCANRLYPKDYLGTQFDGYVDRYYLTSSGSLASNSSYFVSGYMPIPPNTICRRVNSQSRNLSLCFYDENKQYISGIAYNNVVIATFTSPPNAVYVRMTASRSASENAWQRIDVNYTTHPISWQTEAGSITSGTLTIAEDGSVTLDSGGTTYQLQSITPISTLAGENNIWADVNGEITLTYLSVPETAFSDNADTGMADYMTLTE